MELLLPEKTSAVGKDLRRLLGAQKVKDDGPSLNAYAVDASMYKIVPKAIVLPESESDIDATMDYAVRTGVPLTPRAAGTNLAGSAIGPGIILDVSHLNKILELNQEEKWARVQPGMILAELNKQLARSGLMFGPDPSSGDMCKLGGMLANNSSGPHTLRYGSVKDNVIALRVRLESGGWLNARALGLDDPSLHDTFTHFPELEFVFGLIRTHKDLIQSRRPRVSKNSAGYNVFDLADGIAQGVFDLPKLFVGSEGTLGVFSEAKIQLVDCPRSTVTGLIHFRYLEEVGEAVHDLLSLSPTALEIMDANTLDLIGRHKHGIPSDAAATLLIELDQGDDPGREQRIMELCRPYRLSVDPVLAFEKERQEELWKARKALYPTLYRYSQKKKPINFVDDVVVAAERTGELIRYLDEVFGKQGMPVAIFGHIGNGNAHIVPLLDVNDSEDFRRMVESYYEVHQTVLDRFGGSICGEHGDGRVRAEMVRRMFGEELYALFVKVKQALDPAGILNPGVKISDVSFTEHIDYDRLGKPCATCAKCNSVCPVYDVFQSEDMSSRGWFEIVTAKDYSYLNSKRVVEACLNCKSCRTICPADVDVSDLILKRRAEHPNRMAGAIFAVHARQWLFEPLLKMAAWTQPLWDQPGPRAWLEWATRPFLRRLAETARFPKEMKLPRLAKTLLRDRYPELCEDSPRSFQNTGTRTEGGAPFSPSVSSQGTVEGGEAISQRVRGGVAYFHGCAANYFDDGVGDAVIGVLRRYGIEPALPPQRCSGTPIETYGHRNLAKEGARVNLATLASYHTVVTGCASCTLALKDYGKLFEGEPEEQSALDLAKKVKHISELVVESEPNGRRGGGTVAFPKRKVTYHSSCHLRAAGVTKAPRQCLSQVPGIEFVEMEDAERCAGGAGTYMVKDYDTSQKIFQRKRAAIQRSGAEIVATSCPACMIQLDNGLQGTATVKHIAQVVLEALDTVESSGHQEETKR
ncbi:MAG: FAD-binding and (Fe-S)-binding domain-containing protein [Nitrospirae bacterium]|nr:FAD-binding and (Fe-S)-binding domain-containing protein [Nitrospirota bacterium]